MFKGLANFASLIKQASQMGGKLQGVNEELKSKTVTGSAGGGMVEVDMSGLTEARACRIDPSLLQGGDRELLEDMILGAVNQAVSKARELHTEAMQSLTGGMNIPGMDEAMAQVTGSPIPSGEDTDDETSGLGQ